VIPKNPSLSPGNGFGVGGESAVRKKESFKGEDGPSKPSWGRGTHFFWGGFLSHSGYHQNLVGTFVSKWKKGFICPSQKEVFVRGFEKKDRAASSHNLG